MKQECRPLSVGLFAMMRTDKTGIDLIKGFESFSAKRYICPAGLPTIGYGHVILRGENFTTLSEADAEALLMRDLDGFERGVSLCVKTPITQNQFDALVSFAFNCGVAALKSSTLLKKLNAGDFLGAADEFLKWCKGGGKTLPGLVRRRKEERALFLKGM